MDGIPFVQTRDIGRPLVVGSLDRTSSKIAAAYQRSSLKAGDLLLSLRGDIGASTIVPPALEGANISRGVARVRPTDSHDPHFIHYALQAPLVKGSISAASRGSTLREISIGSLRDVRVPTPPLPEQLKIVEILRTWDEAIDRNTRATALRRNLREQLRDRLFVRALEQDGHWTTFGELLSESRLSGTHGGVARKLTIKLYGKGAMPKSSTVTGSSNTKYFVRKAGQLVYSKLDFLNGAFAIVPADLDGYETTLDLPAFDVSPSVNPVWLLEYLLRPRYYQSQVHLARGQRKARRVSPEVFLAEPLWLPERDSQDELAHVLTAATAEIDLSERKDAALRAQKRGLMQKLLTGQVRVNVAAGTEQGGLSDD